LTQSQRGQSLSAFLTPKALIYLFFFTSGMPALAYQLIWQRALFRVFGVNMESVTIVVTAFMLGLGVGSLIGSRLAARRTISPLLLIALIECAIGIFGLCSLRLFDLADYFVQGLSLPAKSMVAIGLVFVPTALMGMTLPLLVGYLISRSANVGLSTGSLYRANTLGAVIGCFLCALLLFPFLGLQGSAWAAAGLNGLVAAAAFAAFLLQDRQEYSSGSTHRVSAQPHATKLLRMPASLALAFFGGYISLSYEIFFFRLAAFASGTSALEIALVLAAFLAGISSGAQRAAEWCAAQDSGDVTVAQIFRFLLANSLFGLLLLPILSLSAPLGAGVLGIILLMAFLIARFFGVMFPLVAHFAVLPDRHSGARVGILYLSNILGSAAGSMLTGFVLADVLSARELAILLSVLSCFVVLLFVWASERSLTRLRVPIAATLATGCVLIAIQGPLSARVMESLLYKSGASRTPALASVIENRNGIIAVSPDGIVYGNGMYDGRFNTSLLHDTNGIVRAYGLSLYHRSPRDVLMIGLSSGSWAQVIANNPDVSRLTIVEINPGYISLIRARPEVASVLRNPKVRIIIDDGRRWLKRYPDRRFDAIVANTTYNFRSNASNVLSIEFDDLIRAHLKPGGVYFFNATDSDRVEKTGCESFRYGYRIFNFILVSDSPIDADFKHWRQNLLDYRIDGRPVVGLARSAERDKLERVLGQLTEEKTNMDLANRGIVENCKNLLLRTSGIQPVTDDNMGTEWRYPLGLH
jgi:spermidine synthase